jgi:hypothetical protein
MVWSEGGLTASPSLQELDNCCWNADDLSAAALAAGLEMSNMLEELQLFTCIIGGTLLHLQDV